MIWAIGIAGGVMLALAALVVATVDDWKRDLSHNRATTEEELPGITPLETFLAPPQAADVVVKAAATIPRWELDMRDDAGDSVTLGFVRTTPLLRFCDDILVTLTSVPGGTRLTATSQSRVGKGDFGQNPRNLRELLNAVRQHGTWTEVR